MFSKNLGITWQFAKGIHTLFSKHRASSPENPKKSAQKIRKKWTLIILLKPSLVVHTHKLLEFDETGQ